MADIEKITLPSGTTYTIADATARSSIADLQLYVNQKLSDIQTGTTGGVRFVGTTTSILTDGCNITPIIINEEQVVPTSGDLAIYGDSEFIAVVRNGTTTWRLFGSTGSLKALAFKSSASGTAIPLGTVSTPIFTGIASTVTTKGTPQGTVSLTQSRPTSAKPANLSLEGTLENILFSGISSECTSLQYTPSGTISLKSISTSNPSNFTPRGTISGGTMKATTKDALGMLALSAGSFTQGTVAECTLPTLEMGVTDKTLKVTWGAGSWTPNTLSLVTMPTFSNETVVSEVTSVDFTELPTFEGTSTHIHFDGDDKVIKSTVTPLGSVTTPAFSTSARIDATFTGSELTSTGAYTPSGTNSEPEFTGKSTPVTVS